MFKFAPPWLTLFALLSVFIPRPSVAQITPAIGATNTTVTVNGQQFDIGGGAFSRDGQNLFHLFQQFGLNEGQIANFLSNPGVRNVLAGVNGGDVSYINGLIQLTGGNSNLYLLNPAGIVFGPNASLNVPAAFHASTASRVHFDGGIFDINGVNDYTNLVGNPTAFEFPSTGMIINEGNLAVDAGQSLTLMGHQVINTGTLSAPGGRITIQAVPETGMVRISQEGMILSLEFPADRIPEDGVIEAVDIPRLITGGEDRLRVNSVVHNPDGSVSLVHDPSKVNVPVEGATAVVSGAVDVSNPEGVGGQINVLGQNVALINAQLNASGGGGGGTILAGGDYLGGMAGTGRLDSSLNAQTTLVDNNSVLSANAITQGNGGTIITWADNSTTFNGSLSARGGELGGDGGFAEISGRETLSIGPGWSSRIDLTAPLGQAGTLLFDPNDITIQGGGGSPIGSSPTNANTLGADDINAFLQNTGSLVIETTGMGGNGDITFENLALVSWLSANNLTLNADRDIVMSIGSGVVSVLGDITYNADRDIVINSVAGVASGFGDITFDAGRDIELNSVSGVASGAGDILFNAGQDIRLNSVTGVADGLRNITFNADRSISLTNSGVATTTGNITFNANAAGMTTGNFIGIELNSATLSAAGGNIQLTGHGGNSGSSNFGIYQHNGAQVSTTSGNITYAGTGGNGMGSNYGIYLTGLNTGISSGDGDILLTGNGGANGTGSNNYGIFQSLAAQVSTTGTGTITYDGTGGNGTSNNYGIYLNGTNAAITTTITSGGGAIELTGTGGDGTNFNYGIYQRNGAQVSTTGTGTITYGGTGGNGASHNYGIYLAGVNTSISSTDGAIALTGTGGGTGTSNYGIYQLGAAQVTSTSGNIAYTGTGASGADAIRTETGSNLIGNGTSGNIFLASANNAITLNNVTVETTGNIQISAPGDVTQNANSSLLAGGLGLLGTGTSSFTLNSATNDIATLAGNVTDEVIFRDMNGFDIGTVNALNGLEATIVSLEAGGAVSQSQALTVESLGLLGTGSFTLNNSANDISILAADITGGNLSLSSAGDLEVGSVTTSLDTIDGLQFTGNVTLTALGEGDISVTENITKTGAGTSNLILQAEGNIFIDPIDIESLGGPLNITLNSDRNAMNGGGIDLCCISIFTNGGDVIMGGGLDPLNTPAIGTDDTLGVGIYAGAWIETNGGMVSMRGRGQDGVDDATGVYLDGAFFETGSGNVFIQGQGGNDGTFNDGILLTPSTTIATTSGNVTLQGQGGNNDEFNGGVVLSPFATIQTTSGNISIQGQGGNNGDDNPGVVIAPIASIVTETGNIFVRGQGGDNGDFNDGIILGESDPTMPTIANNVSGSLVLEGIGGNGAFGITNPCGCIDSFLGNINSTASITLSADRMDLEFIQLQGRGIVTIQPLTPSATMGVGDGAPGTLQLSTDDLNHLFNDPAFNQFSQINFGRSNGTGLVTAQGYTFVNNVTFQSGASGSQGIQVTGPVSFGNNTLGFSSGGPVTQSAPITANALQLNGSGAVTLTNANNNVNTLAANTTNSITYRDANALTLAGVNTNGNILNLTTGGNLNQTAPIQTDGLALTVNGNVDLTHPNNQISRVAAETTGSLSLVNNGTLTVDTVNPTGISSGGAVFLQTLNGNIVLNQPVRSQVGGDAVVLAAANNFTNNAGSSAIQAPNGRWLVYSTDPNLDQLGGLDGSAQFESPYPTNPRFSGSGFLYRVSGSVLQPSTPVISTTVLEPSGAIAPPPSFPSDRAIPSLEFSFPDNIATILQGEEEGNLPLDQSLCEFAGDQSPLDIDGVPVSNAAIEEICGPKLTQAN